ncbi:MAG: complex I NDUFA9 subunit family protein [Hyphomonadaceae bacterium]|nr:complex I NDUFA9 subunit family protein [Hyphomonadaceae bacterium]
MAKGLITVFGADGFLGRFVVRELVKQGWRIRAAVRRPHTAQDLRVIGAVGQIQLVQANIRYKLSVARALDGADAVINLVGILHKEGRQTFESVHVQGVRNIAEAAKERGIANFVYVSALGAGENAMSESAKSKTAGENVLREHVATADIMRPSIIFGEDDGFFGRFAQMSSFAPVLPLVGGGHTRFQPVYVGDVAKAIATSVDNGSKGTTFELGGPTSYTFKELLEFMLATIDKKRLLVPLPWFAANIVGAIGEFTGFLPFVKPVLTRDQVTSLKSDNVVSPDMPGLAELGIKAKTIEAIMPAHLEKFKKYGQFHQAASD